MKITNYIFISVLTLASINANANTVKRFCGQWKKVTAMHGGEELNNGGKILKGTTLIASDLYDHGTDELIFLSAIDQLKNGQSVCLIGELSDEKENIDDKVLNYITGVVID